MANRHSFLSTTGLIRTPSSASSVACSHPASTTSTLKRDKTSKNMKNLILPTNSATQPKLRSNAGVVPLGPVFIVGMVVVLSLLFIGALSCAFVGAEDEAVFKDLLNDLARNNPGILLIGDNVDMDVDEPAVTIRWSIIACGQAYVLKGSEGTHGSSLCGVPNEPLSIYVDGEQTPAATYDPDIIPISSAKLSRLSVQTLYQFDSDHVLDVHEARLYPFDTYHLTTNIRVEISNDTSVVAPITRLVTLTDTASFIIRSSDAASTVTLSSSSSSDERTQNPSRDLDMAIQRPGEARFFALMLFGISWMFAHATVGYVALAWRSASSQRAAYYLVLSIATMMVIPQLRNTMPDAPGYDGILIDQIGLFSQMVVSGISSVILLGTLAKRELTHIDDANLARERNFRSAATPEPVKCLRGPSASIDFRHIRSLSKKFLTRIDPPTPISEYPEQISLMDPFGMESPTADKGRRPSNGGGSRQRGG
ncbi:hypothetical protein BC835DRAFT_1431023 [Cytidiella melzeri]|nr:hypothetical protein BC835DRAFT_1431023 [Cytidiella melzeri]